MGDVEEFVLSGTGVGANISVREEAAATQPITQSRPQAPPHSMTSRVPPADHFIADTTEVDVDGVDPGDEVLNKQQLMLEIVRYRNSVHCGKHLGTLKRRMSDDKLEQATVEELQTLLQAIQLQISCATSRSFIDMGFKMSCQLVEQLATGYTPAKITGFSEAMNNHPATASLVEELTLSQSSVFYVPAHTRLAFVALSVATTLHNANSAREEMEAIKELSKKPPLDPKLLDKAKDL
jgi:hypothetical protein